LDCGKIRRTAEKSAASHVNGLALVLVCKRRRVLVLTVGFVDSQQAILEIVDSLCLARSMPSSNACEQQREITEGRKKVRLRSRENSQKPENSM
jgi:hypothetical protein